MTELATDPEIERLTLAMLACDLPKAAWTHRAHFAAALWLIRHRPDIKPERDMPGLIRAYNVSVGGVNSETAGYHETITQASLRVARMVLAAHPAEAPVTVVLDDLMGREFGRSDWLMTYWTKDRLFSVEARRAWVEPDVKALAVYPNPSSV